MQQSDKAYPPIIPFDRSRPSSHSQSVSLIDSESILIDPDSIVIQHVVLLISSSSASISFLVIIHVHNDVYPYTYSIRAESFLIQITINYTCSWFRLID